MNNNIQFKAKKLISIDDLDLEDIQILYNVTLEFRKILQRPLKKVPALKEITIANLFFEDSTRTRISFELAQKRLSADVVNFSGNSSSIKKGETILDTVKNLLSMKIDLLVIRDKYSGTPSIIYDKTNVPVINAGDGTNEHPTQALLDLFTLWEKGFETKSLHIHLFGDVLHSRVAGSSLKLWKKVGIDFSIHGPNTIRRKTFKANKTFESKKNNILYGLRIQKERLNKELIPTPEEYNLFYGLKNNQISKGWWIMHPGPINRGVELDSEIADSKQSLILNQVEMGVALRMAIIYLLGQKKGG